MDNIEPTLTSSTDTSSEPVIQLAAVRSSKSTKESFDLTKLLIPGAIIVAGLLVSGSILFARYQSGAALDVPGDNQPPEKVEVSIGDSPVLGKSNAPVTVVEFGDFQCPFCERYFTSTQSAIISEYVNSGKVKFVWKDYAFLGQESTWSAQAARCAGDQDKFWEYHDYLYNHQGAENSGAFSKAKLKGFASALGLDKSKFNICLDSDTHLADVQADTQYGSSIGVTGTPATFVNGTLIVGAVPYEKIKAAIDAELNN